MLDLIATIASTLTDALSATDLSRWRGDDEGRLPTAVFMLHLRLLEILESGHKMFVSLHADLANHDRSQTFVTGPVPPFYVGQPFLDDVARQRLNLSRFLLALDYIAPASKAWGERACLILTRAGFGKHNPFDLVMTTLQRQRMPLYVPSVEEWLPADAERRTRRSRAAVKLIARLNARVLDLQNGWTAETATLIRWYIDGGDAQRQLAQLSGAAGALQRVLLDNVSATDILPRLLRPEGAGSHPIYAKPLLR
jgi:hypothetical protein